MSIFSEHQANIIRELLTGCERIVMHFFETSFCWFREGSRRLWKDEVKLLRVYGECLGTRRR